MTGGTGQDPGDADLALERRLRALDPPAAAPAFFERALERAQREGERRQRDRRRWLLSGFGAALAAGIAIVAVVGLWQPATTPQSTLPVVTIALANEETVRLVFSAEEALQAATLTLSLPAGIELAGFPGQRQVEWQTSLEAGQNLLPLTLVATGPAGGEVVATLAHDTRQRSYRLQVDIA